jgi:acyl-CoA thioesterase-1
MNPRVRLVHVIVMLSLIGNVIALTRKHSQCCSFRQIQSNKLDSVYRSQDYLGGIKNELRKKWPGNRTINLVFHGHSVPSGYTHDTLVNTFDSYPYQLLQRLKERYPYAVINIILSSKGGETSIEGAKRLEADALAYRPDVVFIDYALNDITQPLGDVERAWQDMIDKAKARGIKVVLLTPSPDQRIDLKAPGNQLQAVTNVIRTLAQRNKVGLADPFAVFQALPKDSIPTYMSYVNHPNRKGSAVISDQLFRLF